MTILGKRFYEQDTLTVAKKLLGKIFCKKNADGTILKGKIVETEAYTQEEPACHAYRGKTKRSETLFMQGGTLYVYFIYGMYHCVNVVTEKENYGSAVLIRAIEPINNNFEKRAAAGPAKLCKIFNITKELNKIDITKRNSIIRIEDNTDLKENEIIQTVRIGISNATELPWRFYIKDNQSVSKK